MRVRELMTLLEQVDPEATVLFLEPHADACDAVSIDDVFADDRHWLRFGNPVPAKADYFRPEIGCDATENEGMTMSRERVVVLGECLDQLREFGF